MYHQANNIIDGIAQQWVRGPTHGNVHPENDNQPSLSSEKPINLVARFHLKPLKLISSGHKLGMEMGSKPGTSPKMDSLLENDFWHVLFWKPLGPIFEPWKILYTYVWIYIYIVIYIYSYIYSYIYI